MSQEELIALCVKKDSQAWDEFVRTYQGLVRKAAYYRLNKALRNDVDDIVQEVFLTLWKEDKLSSLKDASRLKGWLFIVTINLTSSYGRLPCKRWKLTKSIHDKPSYDKSVTFEDTITSTQPDLAKFAEIKETISCVEEGIGTLKTKERIALELNIYDGQTQKEISKIMNIPTNTASSLIRRAKIKVQEGMMG